MNVPLRCGLALSFEEFDELRRQMMLDGCKWDPQVEDVETLAAFPLLIHPAEWKKLAAWSEQLSAEAIAAEQELLSRVDLHGQLGLPSAIRRRLRNVAQQGPPASTARVMRFDFHWTTDGWRISEANTDVPGGFVEASGLVARLKERYPADSWLPDPAENYVATILRKTNNGRRVALVHATAYTDDRQVMVYLARLLADRGAQTYLCSPVDLQWDIGRAVLAGSTAALDAIIRFFPGEWLPQLPRSSQWQRFFDGGLTPMSNPGTALVIQSKRFPLVWDRLRTSLPTWRTLLPETRDPRNVDWRRDSRWVLKPALGRVGDGIGLRGVIPEKEWRQIARAAWWFPADWVAQRRFEMVPVDAERQPVFPVIGVFTIDGQAAGAYGRIATRPLINHLAQDVAVFTDPLESTYE